MLEAFEASGAAGVSVEAGEPVRLPAAKARILGLVLHDLATNAIRHGALSSPDGTARISWSVSGGASERLVRLDWTESNGPPAEPPERRGFGARLTTDLAGRELGGEARADWRREGLRYTLEFPVD